MIFNPYFSVLRFEVTAFTIALITNRLMQGHSFRIPASEVSGYTVIYKNRMQICPANYNSQLPWQDFKQTLHQFDISRSALLSVMQFFFFFIMSALHLFENFEIENKILIMSPRLSTSVHGV